MISSKEWYGHRSKAAVYAFTSDPRFVRSDLRFRKTLQTYHVYSSQREESCQVKIRNHIGPPVSSMIAISANNAIVADPKLTTPPANARSDPTTGQPEM